MILIHNRILYILGRKNEIRIIGRIIVIKDKNRIIYYIYYILFMIYSRVLNINEVLGKIFLSTWLILISAI